MKHAIFWLAPSPTARTDLSAAVERHLLVPELSRRVQLIRTTPTAKTGRGLKIMVALRALGELNSAIRYESGAPVIHLHLDEGASFYRDAVLAARARAGGGNIVISVHGRHFGQFAAQDPRTVRTMFSRASRIIALTPNQRSELAPYVDHSRLTVLPHGVVLPKVVPLQQHEEVPVVLYPSGGDVDAGSELLVKAVGALPRGVKARWLLAGEGDLDTMARALRNTRRGPVEVVGWLRGSRAERIWARTNIVVLPALRESLPIWVVEAMARARPVLASTAGGLPDAVGAGGGWIVADNHPTTWTRALRTAFASRPDWEHIGDVGRTRAEALFDGDRVAERLLEIYSEVAGGRRTPVLLRLPDAMRAIRAHLPG